MKDHVIVVGQRKGILEAVVVRLGEGLWICDGSDACVAIVCGHCDVTRIGLQVLDATGSPLLLPADKMLELSHGAVFQ